MSTSDKSEALTYARIVVREADAGRFDAPKTTMLAREVIALSDARAQLAAALIDEGARMVARLVSDYSGRRDTIFNDVGVLIARMTGALKGAPASAASPSNPTWKPPLTAGPAQKDMRNGGEYQVVRAADGAWVGDFRSKFADVMVAMLNAIPSSVEPRDLRLSTGMLEGYMRQAAAHPEDVEKLIPAIGETLRRLVEHASASRLNICVECNEPATPASSMCPREDCPNRKHGAKRG